MRWVGWASLCVIALCAVPAHAQPADAQTKAAARDLGQQGIDLYKAGKYSEALDAFDRATKLVNVPTLNLYAARCLEKLNRFIEANERYLATLRIELDKNAHADQKRAKELAEAEQKALAARIPKLEIVIENPPEGVEVKLDDRVVPAALLGASQPVDPGTHRVTATAGDRKAEKSVTLEAGKSERIVLALQSGAQPAPIVAPPPPAAASPSVAPTATPPPERDRPPESDKGTSQKTLGYVALGVGGAGILFGVITGGLGTFKKGDLDDKCPNRTCPPDAYDDVDSYDRMRLMSTIGFAVGFVGLGAGGALLLTAPSEKSAVRVGPRGVTYSRSF